MSSSRSERNNPSSQDLGLTSLLQLMSNEFTDSVVTRVLGHRSQLPEDVQAVLAGAINREVRVQGFPNFPERALPGLLKPAILDALPESDPLAGAVLSAWLASRTSLPDAVTEHLCSRGIETGLPDFIGYQLREFWPSHEWTSERDIILESHDDLDKDDVALMLCCVTGRMPRVVAEPPRGENSSMGQNVLDQALEVRTKTPFGEERLGW